MRKKEIRTIIVFSSTSHAMAFYDICKKENAPGKAVPVPGNVKAGCGMAWCIKPSEREEIIRLINRTNSPYEGIYETEFFV